MARRKEYNPYDPKQAKIVGATPEIGQGNLAVLGGVIAELRAAGIEIAEQYPHGLMVKLFSEAHIFMSADTKRSIEYSQKSTEMRGSAKTAPLLWELKNFLIDMHKKYPNAQFFLTPQNMFGELATTLEIK